MGLKLKLPWWVKVGLKIGLSMLPFPYSVWKRVGVFRHGNMDDPIRAIQTFEKFYNKATSLSGLEPGFTSLELGPGDSLLSGFVAHAYGAEKKWLIDAGEFAETSLEDVRFLGDYFRKQGNDVISMDGVTSIDEALKLFNVNYLTGGTLALRDVPDSSVDFFWSQVVLEHVPKAEFSEFLDQLRRVAKPNAVGIHSIDFRDHLSGGLNNLRFPEKLWEGKVFKNAGFYTNRIRPREMLRMFDNARFSVELLGETRWPIMPIKRKNLSKEFEKYPDEDFMVAEIEVKLRPMR